MIIDNSSREPEYVTVGNSVGTSVRTFAHSNVASSNVTRLPVPIARYLSFSLGQNSYYDDSPLISIEPNQSIAIRTLGDFSIHNEEENLKNLYKGQHKPIEMLKALVALGGKNIGEMRLCEALWPDTDGDVAHSAFSVTLHRLRKLVGHSALELNDSRLSLNPQNCWVDVWVVEQLLNSCNRIMSDKQVDKQHALQSIESAMKLYNGPFLGNEDEQPWYIMYRQRLHSKLLRSLLNVCAYLESLDRCDLALDLYHKGIELEPLAEDFYFRLMQCLATHDRKAEAVSIYLRCRKVFQMTIGVNPSRATESLYQSLLN